MSVFVFTGPTISPAEARVELEAIYLPPAGEGDVYRVAQKRPQAIGIIDGYFQSVPAVRHKEILWAMSRGIHVFGSASMGALRAAELSDFGMEGVGAIFESFRDGTLEDDDEVAIAHGPPESGFMAGSEAMVNIRETLRKAELADVISKKLRTSLEKIAKDLFYPDRSYPMLLRRAAESGLPEAELTLLREWLPRGQVNQKREDALAMLRLMRERLEDGLEPKAVSYWFEHTAMWETACRQSGELRLDAGAESRLVLLESLVDELRVKGDAYKQQTLLALERYFAIREANRLGMTVTTEARKQAELAFRRENDLADAGQLERWMTANGLGPHEFDSLMMDEARVRWVHRLTRLVSVSSLPEQLRLTGDYPRLLARAEAKSRWLESVGSQDPSLETAGLTESELLQWYFEKDSTRPVPSDLNSYAQDLGFATVHAFRRALLREYLYTQHEKKTADDR
ncbi:MAG: TfuA-like protein [Chthoniobacterales bacterium]